MAAHSPVDAEEYPEFAVLIDEHQPHVKLMHTDDEGGNSFSPNARDQEEILDNEPKEFLLVDEKHLDKELPEVFLRALGVPTNDDCLKKSLEIGTDPEDLTDNTFECSDLTEEAMASRKSTSFHFSTNSKPYLLGIAAIFTRSRVRILSVANVLFALMIFTLSILVVAYGSSLLTVYNQYSELITKDRPCFFEWGEWTQCSATCRVEEGKFPVKSRKALGFIHASGIYAGTGDDNPCSVEAVKKIRDTVPCNIFKCPIPMAILPFGECIRANLSGDNESCIHTRVIHDKTQLVELDNITPLYEQCDCLTGE